MESSDEEYFPTQEELEEMEQDEQEDEEMEDDDHDEEEEEDDGYDDPNDASQHSNTYYVDDEEEGEYEEEGVDAAVERILLQSHPGFLRQIQQVLQHGVRLRAAAYGEDFDNAHRRISRRRRLQDLPPTPYKAGKRLLSSGEFGEIDDPRCRKRRFEGARTVTQFARFRELGWRRGSTVGITKKWLPGSEQGKIVAQYDRHVYSGQFSHDGTFFYTAAQDFKCRMYQTLNPASPYDWKLYKVLDVVEKTNFETLRGEIGRWTITDATLSHDNRFLAYSSITPCVYFARTGSTSSLEADAGDSWRDGLGPDENQTVLDFSGYNGTGRFPALGQRTQQRMSSNSGIWSLRFSADGRELVAGASDKCLYVYDVEIRKITLQLEGHSDDINAVCFADPLSTNVLFSGSDDSLVKVWDRRSMAGGREAGCLPGHMEGITFVATKGDGRYVISNGKDQTLKLWDIRKMMERSAFEKLPKKDFQSGFDYRWMDYPGPAVPKHPKDCSVTTYVGHRVLKTLIRCHFSPPSSTGQQYLYSGSEDGRVHIWNLDGTVARVIDVGKVLTKAYRSRSPLQQGGWGYFEYDGRRRRSDVSATVRDVSWHPYEGVLVTSSWTSAGESGAVTIHAWEGETE